MDEWSDHGNAWTFSVEELTALSRSGPLPQGYLDALHIRRQAHHARLQREITATFAAAANDPDMLHRLTRPL